MDIVTLIMQGVRVVLGFLNLLFVPGFILSLVFFPRFTDMGLIERLAYSTVLSIGSVIATVLFMDVVLGVDTTPQNISLAIGVFTVFMLVIWLCEVWYLSSSLPARVHKRFSGGYRALQNYFSRLVNSRRDRFNDTTMIRVVWHENIRSGMNQVDHTYLIDAGEEFDVQLVDEHKWKASEPALVPPPYPAARYFELVIREFKEEGLSLIDDLQVYPVHVTKKPDVTFLGLRILRGAPKITRRIYEKSEFAEVQWIYSHDFHLFAILYSQDTLGQIVDRVLAKLDEIVTSIKKGSRISSHVEDTQKLKDEFEVILERPRRIPTITGGPIRYPESPLSPFPVESDRRRLQADIVRDLKVTHITPGTFRSSAGGITDIKIPEKTVTDKLKATIKEIQDDDWLYE